MGTRCYWEFRSLGACAALVLYQDTHFLTPALDEIFLFLSSFLRSCVVGYFFSSQALLTIQVCPRSLAGLGCVVGAFARMYSTAGML
jgi:hypothetical protein